MVIAKTWERLLTPARVQRRMIVCSAQRIPSEIMMDSVSALMIGLVNDAISTLENAIQDAMDVMDRATRIVRSV